MFVRRRQSSNSYLNNLFVIQHSTIWANFISGLFQGQTDECSTLNLCPSDGPKSQTSMLIQLFDIWQSEKVYQVFYYVRPSHGPKTIFNISASPTWKFDRMNKLDYLLIFCLFPFRQMVEHSTALDKTRPCQRAFFSLWARRRRRSLCFCYPFGSQRSCQREDLRQSKNRKFQRWEREGCTSDLFDGRTDKVEIQQDNRVR